MTTHRLPDSTAYTADPTAQAALRSPRPTGHGPVRAYDWVGHHAANRPSQEAVRELNPRRHHSYADLDRRAEAMAAHLQALGIGRGERVALLAHNGVEFFDLQFACGRTGGIAVLLNWRLTATELEYILNDSAPLLLIHDVEFTETARTLQQRCNIRHLLCIDKPAAANPYEAALAAQAGKTARREVLTHDDVVTIMYTSGTTGHPKGAMVTHGMNFWNCSNLGTRAGVGQRTVHLSVLPLFHTGGLNCYSNPVLHAGGTVVIMRNFDSGAALRVIGDAAEGITHFFAVPAPYQFMLQHPDFASTDLSRLQSAGVGGAPCALPILQGWGARGIHLMQGFGMTETSPACISLDPADAQRKLGSTGKTLLHTEARIVNDAGVDCGPDEIGELWVAGPNITPGYWNRPDATAAAFGGPLVEDRRRRPDGRAKGSSTSSTGGRTCTSPAARTSTPPKWKTCCISCPRWPRPRSSACPATSGARWAWRCWRSSPARCWTRTPCWPTARASWRASRSRTTSPSFPRCRAMPPARCSSVNCASSRRQQRPCHHLRPIA